MNKTETMLAQLTQARLERKDVLDLPQTMTRREMATYERETVLLDSRIAAIRSAMETLTKADTDADTEWLNQLNSWRKVLCDELLAFPSRLHTSGEKEVMGNLMFSIKIIDFGFGAAALPVVSLAPLPLGELMAAAGYATTGPELRSPRGWRGSIPEVEQRIAELVKRRAAAQAALDVAMTDDTEREEESKARRDALNALPQRKTRGDGSQYDKWPDGRCVEVLS